MQFKSVSIYTLFVSQNFTHEINDISDADTLPKPIKQHHIDPEEFRKREHEKFNTAAEVNETKDNKECDNHVAIVTNIEKTETKQEEVSSIQEPVEIQKNQEPGMLIQKC